MKKPILQLDEYKRAKSNRDLIEIKIEKRKPPEPMEDHQPESIDVEKLELNDVDRNILRCMNILQTATYVDISAALKVSKKVASKRLSALFKDGILARDEECKPFLYTSKESFKLLNDPIDTDKSVIEAVIKLGALVRELNIGFSEIKKLLGVD